MYRYERKFSFPGMTMPEVEAYVKLLPGMFSEIYRPRFVNNLYLDTTQLRSYFDNVDGFRDRTKVRVRWYGDLFGIIEKPVLEIKFKKGLLGKKESHPLAPFLFDQAFRWDAIWEVFNKAEIPAMWKLELSTLEPSLVNRYRRKYFQSSDRKFRFTIDTDMTYYQVNLHYNSFLHSSRDDTGTILELKYDADDDDRINSLLKRLPFRISRSSKYVIGKDRLFFA
jgi:hypothetical protein